MKSGDLLVESSSLRQSEQLLSITKFGDIPITLSAHASLNYTRGVMSSDEFLMVSDSEFVSELEAQKFSRKKITAGYISCDIRPYIPNPVRCFKCQRFGHTKTACRGSSALCPRCSEPGHEETICQNPEKCFNCKGNHASYSKTCPKWKLEKEIQSVKVTRNISIQEARKIVHDRTPKPNHSYSAALKTIKNPDSPLAPIQTSTDTTVPKPSTSAAKNEETITVKLSDWLALLKAHKLSLEKEKTNDKKQEFLKPAPKNKRPKKDHTNSTGKNSNVKMKSNPNKTKSQNKESESDLQTSDNSISEMELGEERNDFQQGSRASGGVACLTSCQIPSKPILLNTQLQAVAIQIQLNSLTVCYLYLPPRVHIEKRHLDALIRQLPSPFFLLGDFNGHNTLWGSTDTNPRGCQIETLVEDHGLCLLNDNSYTHFHQASQTFHTIDLAICSPSLVPYWKFSTCTNLFNSDHFPIVLTYVKNDFPFPKRPVKYIFGKADWPLFESLCQLTPNMVDKDSIDVAVNTITDCIISSADNSIPKTSGNIPKLCKPWWNTECDTCQKTLEKAWYNFRRYPTTHNLIKFKKARAKFRQIRRQSMNTTWCSYVNSITRQVSSKVVWDKVISDAKEIGNVIGQTLSEISSESSYPNDFIAFKKREEQKSVDFLPSYAEDYNSTFSYHELKDALRKSNPTSPGPDQIHNDMLKHLGESSLLTILLLFNRIWQERVFPLSWLKAIVVPIPKPGKDKQDPNNYRPIALTSCLSKLLEHMVSARLMHVLERSKWFVPSQSGFRRRRNTIDNLLKLETAIREAFVRKKHLVSIFFDIGKAYDRTWRYGILKDLSDIGLKGNLPLFIKNFLQTRIFQICIGNILSDNFNQQEGVPQGSVLSVLRFIIQINGIVSKLPAYVNSTLFVDDIQIHCAGDDMDFIQRQLQTAINNMTDWSSKNGFIFSPQKTVYMHFCRRRGLHPDSDFQLNGSPIPIVQETKFLGIIFDTKLTFRSHIKHLKTKCIRTLNIMKVLSSTSWGADKVSLMRIYRSLVRSKLDYGVPIYGSAAKSTLKMLDSVHHQGLRIATGAFRTTPIPSLHVISGEPSLELRRHRLSLSYFYKIKSDESHPQHYK
ncbi:putative RNA-directed DNA polymerase from transposon X-element, partial [Araneus ventricosus]